MPKGPKGKPRSTSSDVPLDDNENFIKLLETALKSERIIKCLKDAIVTLSVLPVIDWREIDL